MNLNNFWIWIIYLFFNKTQPWVSIATWLILIGIIYAIIKYPVWYGQGYGR